MLPYSAIPQGAFYALQGVRQVGGQAGMAGAVDVQLIVIKEQDAPRINPQDPGNVLENIQVRFHQAELEGHKMVSKAVKKTGFCRNFKVRMGGAGWRLLLASAIPWSRVW